MSKIESSLLNRLRDRDLFISYGLVASLRPDDIEKVRAWLESNGVKIVFQTTSTGPLFLLREYQVRRALQGDTSLIREVYERKQKMPLERGLPKKAKESGEKNE